jgi:hypothetical protein
MTIRNLYWVNGDGTWDNDNQQNWSDTSGGIGGQSPPLFTDNVIVDNNSGSPVITLSGALSCASLTTTGATCTLTSTGELAISEGMTLSATTTWSATGLLTLNGTVTVTTNGVSISSPITIDATGSTITLSGLLTTNKILTLTAGTLDLNGNDLTCSKFFSDTNNVRAILFGPNFINATSLSNPGTTAAVYMPNIANFSNTGTGGFNVIVSPVGTGSDVIIGNFSGNQYGANGPNVWVTGDDATSGMSIQGASTLKNLNFTGFNGTYYLQNQIRVWGSLTLSPTMTIEDTLENSGIEFRSTNSGNIIDTAGLPINFIVFTGVGGSWELQDSLNVKTFLTLTAGTLNLNGFDANCFSFESTGTTTRSINFGDNFVNITGTATATVLNMNTSTAFTPTGTGGFKLIGAAASGITRTINVGTTGGSVATAPNVFVAAGAAGSIVAITNNSWVRDLNFTGFSGTFTPSTNTYNIAGSFTLSDAMLYTISDNTTYNFVATTTGHTLNLASPARQIGNVVFNGVGGGWTLLTNLLCTPSTITLTAGALNLNNFASQCRIWTCTGTGVRSIAFGTSGIIISATVGPTTGINFANLTNFSYTGTSDIFVGGNGTGPVTINIGTTGATEANAMNVRIFTNSTGREFTFTSGSVVRNLTTSGVLGIFTPPAALTIFGSLTAGAAGTWTTGTGTITFASTSSGRTITTAGKTLYNVTFNGVGGVWTLQDSLNVKQNFQFSTGTFNANNQNLTAHSYLINSGTVNMGSGTWNVGTINGTDIARFRHVGGTINANTSTINMVNRSNGVHVFNGNGQTYYNLNLAGAGDPLTGDLFGIYGSNIFNVISSSAVGSVGIDLEAGTTQTVNDWTVDGVSPSKLVYINSFTPGIQATISKSSGTVNTNYTILADNRAIGGATFNATFINADGGNNTGWIFGTTPNTPSQNFLEINGVIITSGITIA